MNGAPVKTAESSGLRRDRRALWKAGRHDRPCAADAGSARPRERQDRRGRQPAVADQGQGGAAHRARWSTTSSRWTRTSTACCRRRRRSWREWRADLLNGVNVIKGTFADGAPMLAIPNFARYNRNPSASAGAAFPPGGTRRRAGPTPRPAAAVVDCVDQRELVASCWWLVASRHGCHQLVTGGVQRKGRGYETPRPVCLDQSLATSHYFALGARLDPPVPFRAAARAWLLVSVVAASDSASSAARLPRSRSAAARSRPPTPLAFGLSALGFLLGLRLRVELAADQLDLRHLGRVAPAEADPEDAGVAAGPRREARRDSVEQLGRRRPGRGCPRSTRRRAFSARRRRRRRRRRAWRS